MVDTIKLPIVGPQNKKAVMIGGGALVVVFGYGYYRSRQAASTAAATTTTDTSQIDPATGFAYGTPEDAQALAAQTSYANPVDYGGGGGGGTSSTNTPASTGIGFVSNAQWEQAVIDYLTSTGAVDIGVLSPALGKYLSGSATNDAEQTIIHQATAAEGPPPVAGLNGYPPAIRTGGAEPAKPVTPSTKYTMPDGFYILQPGGAIYQASGNVRHYVSPVTWKSLKPQPHAVTVLKDSTLFKLPQGPEI